MMASISLPRILYTGQLYRISVDATETGYEYRTIYTGPTGGWQLPAFTGTGTYQVDTSASYWASIGLQSRLIGSMALASNTYEGQIPIFDLSKAYGLLHQSFDGRLQVHQFDSDISREAAETAWRSGITSWQGFSQFVETKFQAVAATLPFVGDEARAFYFMQWVSGLWKYGNLTNPEAPGCVITNEETGPIDPMSVTVRTFLDSPIGCCTDYTTVLGFLLMNAGIETRTVTGLGHVFLEAKLNGAWWSIDANLNLAMRAPFDQVLDTSQTIEIYRFDHAGMMEGSPIFRDTLSDFYHYHMQMLEFGHFEGGARRDALTFLNTLEYGHTFRDALASTGWTGNDQDFAVGGAASRGYTIGDFDGDGRDDVMEAVSGNLGAKVRLSNGSALDAATTWSLNAKPSTSTGAWLVGDYNGDGRDDLLSDQGGTNAALVYISMSTSFSAPASWTAVSSGDWNWWSGDFNGDGRTDIMRMLVGISGAEVHLSTGAAFVLAGSWTGAGSGSHRWYVGDFNGDGRDDLAGYQIGVGTLVHLSSGVSFNSDGYWSTADTGDGATFFIGDFNGDGRDDLGRRATDGTFEVLQSTGDAFAAPSVLTTRYLLPTYELQVGDFDGDQASNVFFSQRIFNGGAIQTLTNAPSYNGLTVTEMGRIIPFTASRFKLSEVDSPIATQAAAVDLSSFRALQALYNQASVAFALQSNAAHFAAFSAPVDRVMFFAQWIGNLSLDAPPTSLSQAVSVQREKATLLAAFLDHAAIESHVITAGDATVNEVFVDGGWWSINAALGIAMQGRWHHVIDTATAPRGFLFDTAAMTAGTAAYSPFVAQLKENFILASSTGVGFEFERAQSIDWIASQLGGARFAGFIALPLETLAAQNWNSPLHGGRKWFSGDFDGDGRADLMSSAGSRGATIALSNGMAFDGGVAWTENSSGNQGWYVGDFNGDQRTDIFSVVSGVSGAQMLLSTGSGFVSGGSWTGAGSGAQRWYVADFNGDGRDDVLRYLTGVSGAQVMLSDGMKFLATVSWTGAGQGSIGRWLIGDYDGDGKEDLGRVLNGTGFQVLSSTGLNFSSPVTWLTGVSSSNRFDVMDANGDGLDDLVVHGTAALPNRLYLSTGAGFVASNWSSFTASTVPLLIGDFDGNGTDDASRFVHWSTPAQVNLTRPIDQVDTINADPDVVESFAIEDGFGRLIINDITTTGALADHINIGSTLATTYAGVASAMQQVGLDVVIDFGDGDSLTLREVVITALTTDLFIF